MNDTGNVTEEGQNQVQPEGAGAADLEEDTQGRKEDRHNDLNNVTANHVKLSKQEKKSSRPGAFYTRFRSNLVQPHRMERLTIDLHRS